MSIEVLLANKFMRDLLGLLAFFSPLFLAINLPKIAYLEETPQKIKFRLRNFAVAICTSIFIGAGLFFCLNYLTVPLVENLQCNYSDVSVRQINCSLREEWFQKIKVKLQNFQLFSSDFKPESEPKPYDKDSLEESTCYYIKLETDLGYISFYRTCGKNARQQAAEVDRQIKDFLQEFTVKQIEIGQDDTNLLYGSVNIILFFGFIFLIPSRTIGTLDKTNNTLILQKSYLAGTIITTYREVALDKIERIFLESSDGDSATYDIAFQLKDGNKFSLCKMYSSVGVDEKQELARRLDRFIKTQPDLSKDSNSIKAEKSEIV